MEHEPSQFGDPATVEARRTSFGARAQTYDAVRPPWPAETVDWMLGHPAEPLRVLDVGAGTGLGTRTIAGLGHTVVALDLSAEMLAALAVASERLPAEVAARIETRVGPAEQLTDADATYDAVTSFQAWHWIEASRAAPECARVLVPGGRLSLAWYSWADGVAWLHELADLVGTPEMIWDPAARGASGGPKRIEGFEPPDNTQFAIEQQMSVEDLVRLASSWSPVAVRDDRDAVLTAVRELGLRVADDDGMLVFPYVSDCLRYRRR
jgi:SAM-dependent methyltransferase